MSLNPNPPPGHQPASSDAGVRGEMAAVSASAPGVSDLLDDFRRPAGKARRSVPRRAGTLRLLLSELVICVGWRRLAVAGGLILVGAVLEGVGILLILPLLQTFLEPGAHGALADRAPADWLLAPLGARTQYSILFA